jgi:hypothetical protein
MPPIVPPSKDQDNGFDPEIAKGVAATALTGAGAYGLRQGYLHTPNRHITVTGGHLKNWGPKKTGLGQTLREWGMFPEVTQIDDTGAGHLAPAEAYYEELLRHPQVSLSGEKDKWIPDSAYRGGRHSNQLHKLAPSRFAYNHSFGTIDTGFGALSHLPPGMDMPGNEFTTNPLGRIFVETDPVPHNSSPNVSAMGSLNPSNFHSDTNVSTFGGQRRNTMDKIDVNSASGPVDKGFRQWNNLFAGKYKTVSHSPDISPLLKDEMINGADNINRGNFTKDQVLQELLKNPQLSPQTKTLIQQAIEQKKKIALITGSSRGDFVGQRTNEMSKYLRDNNRNDVQLISVLGERMQPSVEQLINNQKIDPVVRDHLKNLAANNPNFNIEEAIKSMPEGAGRESIEDILKTPHLSGLIDDPNVIQLPGLYGDMEYKTPTGQSGRAKQFLALQAIADAHHGSTGASSFNESLMLPGASAYATDLEGLREREIQAAKAKGLITPEQEANLRKVDMHVWNKGTVQMLQNQYKGQPGIGTADTPEEFFKFMDQNATPEARKARMIRAAKNVLRARMAKRHMVDDHIQFLNKQHSKAKWMSRGYTTAGGLAVAAGLPLGMSAISNILARRDHHKQGMEKDASPRWAQELLKRQLATKGNPGLQTGLQEFKRQLKGAVPQGKTRLIGKLPGKDENSGQGLLGRGFEGDAMRAFTGGVGDSVLKQHHFKPVMKERSSGMVKVKPTLTKKQISSEPQTLSPDAYSSGTPIQEKIDLMKANPDLFAKVHHSTPTGYAMEHLVPADRHDVTPGSKAQADLKDLIGRLHDKMHWYQKLWTDKDEMYHQFMEGNPKDKWGGRYRQIFGNRTPIDLQDGTSIEDYHMGNVMYNPEGKMVIGDPQLSHRGTMLGRHAAVAGIGAGALGTGIAGVNALTPDHQGLDGTDAALLGTSALGAGGATAANYHTGQLGKMSPLRNRFFGPSLAAAGIPLALSAGRHMLGGGAQKQADDKTVDRMVQNQLLKDDVNFISPATKERIIQQLKEEAANAKSSPLKAKLNKVLDTGLSGMLYGGGAFGLLGAPVGAALGAGYEGANQFIHGDKELDEESKIDTRHLDQQVDKAIDKSKDDTGFQTHKALHTGTAAAGVLGLAHMPMNYGINKLQQHANTKLPELKDETVAELLKAHKLEPKFKYDHNGVVNDMREQVKVNKPTSEKSQGMENAWFSEERKLSKQDKKINPHLEEAGLKKIKKPSVGSVNFTSRKMWRPNILSHELGHADIHREKSLTGFMQRHLYKPTSGLAYGVLPSVATAYATKDDDSVMSGAGKGALIGAAAHAPSLIPEFEASRRGIKAINKTSLSSKAKGRNALGLTLPFATYALSRVGMNAGVGGLNAYMNKRRNVVEKKAFHEGVLKRASELTGIPLEKLADAAGFANVNNNILGQGSNTAQSVEGAVGAGSLVHAGTRWAAGHLSALRPVQQGMSFVAAHPAIAKVTGAVSSKAGPIGLALNAGSNLYDYSKGYDPAGAFEHNSNSNFLPDTGGHYNPLKWNNWGAIGNAASAVSNPIGAMSGAIRGGSDLGKAWGDEINTSHTPQPGESIKPLNAPQAPPTNTTLPPAIVPKPIQPNTATTPQPKARSGGLNLGATKPMKPSLGLGLGDSLNHMKFGFEIAKLAPVVDDIAQVGLQHLTTTEPEEKKEAPPIKVATFPHIKHHFEHHGEYYTDPGNFTLVHDAHKKQEKSRKKHHKEDNHFLNKTAGPWDMSWADLWDMLFGKKKPVDPNANINLNPVKSSNIHSIGYDEPSKTMEVKFNNKGVYRYPNIRKWQFNDFQNAESKGRFFAKHFRQEKDFKKVAGLSFAFSC